MGERLLCKQEVDGSIPFSSTRVETGFTVLQGTGWSLTWCRVCAVAANGCLLWVVR